jgi:hypothetical protein
LSAGLPIVTTSLGVEGLAVRHNRECLIADQPNKFAQAVVKILSSKKLASQLVAKASYYIKKHHHPDQNNKFLAQYDGII